MREWVEPQHEIGPQLEQRGIRPRDVVKVVMTHLHTDHAGGLHHFPDSEILVSETELKLAAGRGGRVAPDEREARVILERIQAFARSTPTVYLVAHDPGTAKRLAQREVVNIAEDITERLR